MAAYRRVITVDLASRNGHLIGINQGNGSDVAWVRGKAKISPRQEPEGAEDGVGWSEMGRPGERTNIATVNGIGISFHCVIAICKTSFVESKGKVFACQNV